MEFFSVVERIIGIHFVVIDLLLLPYLHLEWLVEVYLKIGNGSSTHCVTHLPLLEVVVVDDLLFYVYIDLPLQSHHFGLCLLCNFLLTNHTVEILEVVEDVYLWGFGLALGPLNGLLLLLWLLYWFLGRSPPHPTQTRPIVLRGLSGIVCLLTTLRM